MCPLYRTRIAVYRTNHRRRVLFSLTGGGGGGCVHIQIPVSWVGGGKLCKLHAFVHIYVLKVHDYVYIYMINIPFMHGIS